MDTTTLCRLFDYHYWANHRVWDCVLKLTETQFEQEVNYSVGSLKTQLVHTMMVEMMWFGVVTNTLPADRQPPFDPQTLKRDAICALWAELETKVQAYLNAASDAELNRVIDYNFPWCGEQHHPAWEALLYVITHAVDHRAQILRGIHDLGGETVMQDYIRYVWDQNVQP